MSENLDYRRVAELEGKFRRAFINWRLANSKDSANQIADDWKELWERRQDERHTGRIADQLGEQVDELKVRIAELEELLDLARRAYHFSASHVHDDKDGYTCQSGHCAVFVAALMGEEAVTE